MAIKKYTIKSIGITTVAKIEAVFMLIMGFFFGFVYAALNLGGIGLLWVPLLAIIYGVLGFVFGAISAFLYNAVAGWLGGIEIAVERAK